MRSFGHRAVVLAVAAFFVAACSSSGKSAGVTAAPITTGAATTTPAATPTTTPSAAPTTAALTTVGPTATDVPASSTNAVTSTPAAPTAPTPTLSPAGIGWTQVATFPNEVFPPFDESNWTGKPSPALPATGTKLADGIYQASVATPWSSANPNSLDIVVKRLEACTKLPAANCVSEGDPFQATDMGVDNAASLALTVPLDGTVKVGLTGYDCDPVDKTGNGADLAALLAAFEQGYTGVIVPQINAGTAPEDIINNLNTSPAQGFTGHDPSCENGGFDLVFHDGDAPPLLLQQVVNTQFSDGEVVGTTPFAPTDLVRLDTVQVSGGAMTLFFYAGFYS